jgi:Restriction endonuclease NotI
MSKVLELFGYSNEAEVDWANVAQTQPCPYLERSCVKTRKSQPEIAIGTCSVAYGGQNVIICPHRLLERRQVFLDCLHLLTRHEPGNELHVIAEISIPGGSVDYVLTSARDGKIVDFVGIELQTLDTTGSVWSERQDFLRQRGLPVVEEMPKTFGMNWKMTAKTILVQLHHKIETFEHLGRHLALVIQTPLEMYMRREFNFAHIGQAKLGDSLHVHAYNLEHENAGYRLRLGQRWSTDAAGIAMALGLQNEARVELAELVRQLERKVSDRTRLQIG